METGYEVHKKMVVSDDLVLVERDPATHGLLIAIGLDDEPGVGFELYLPKSTAIVVADLMTQALHGDDKEYDPDDILVQTSEDEDISLEGIPFISLSNAELRGEGRAIG